MIWLVRLVMGEERVAISLLNDEQMRNWLGVDHWPVIYDIYIHIHVLCNYLISMMILQ